MSFAFDPDMEPGQRVIENSVKVGGKNLELERVSRNCYIVGNKTDASIAEIYTAKHV